MDPAAFVALAVACAPGVAPETLLALAQVESGLDPLAIGVNEPRGRVLRPPTKAAAAARAEALIAAGGAPDLGLAQINARNLSWLGLSPRAAFDPCANLAASARILQVGYRRAAPRRGDEQAALRVALSYYNSGHPRRGFESGYVAKVVAAAGRLASRPEAAAPRATAAPPWAVFAPSRGRPPSAAFVFSVNLGAEP